MEHEISDELLRLLPQPAAIEPFLSQHCFAVLAKGLGLGLFPASLFRLHSLRATCEDTVRLYLYEAARLRRPYEAAILYRVGDGWGIIDHWGAAAAEAQ